MDDEVIDGVILTPLKIIEVSGGNVMHAMKSKDQGFSGYGEAYFSLIEPGAVKAWKRHHEMILNIVVPYGKIRFVLFDDRYRSPTHGCYQVIELSIEDYFRLTVPPMVWMGFQGMGRKTNMLLNIASIPHEPDEADRKIINEIQFDWSMSK